MAKGTQLGHKEEGVVEGGGGEGAPETSIKKSSALVLQMRSGLDIHGGIPVSKSYHEIE